MAPQSAGGNNFCSAVAFGQRDPLPGASYLVIYCARSLKAAKSVLYEIFLRMIREYACHLQAFCEQ
jgi:hypothetical protein